MRKSFENSELLCIVPAGGRGTRLDKLTEQRAKPSIAVGFDPTSGEIKRMIDMPLESIRQLGGTALVTTYYAAHSLEFVDTYDYVQRVNDGGYVTPIDSIVQNRALVEASEASVVGIVPADAQVTVNVLAGMCEFMADKDVTATILATKHLGGHNIRPVDAHGMVTPANSTEPDDYLGDLGVHLFDKKWLLERIDECGGGSSGSIDVWDNVYQIDHPVTDVALFVPSHDKGWVDMGTPIRLQETIYALNASRVDANGNVQFPDARLDPNSTGTIALPASTGLVSFHNAIIPENVTAVTINDIVEV